MRDGGCLGEPDIREHDLGSNDAADVRALSINGDFRREDHMDFLFVSSPALSEAIGADTPPRKRYNRSQHGYHAPRLAVNRRNARGKPARLNLRC